MNREKQIEEIRKGLAFIESYISIGRTTNLTDPNIHAEEFVRGLLNILFDLKLTNANLHVANFPCIDLIDRKLGIGVQVTAEKGSPKISKTIDCLERKSMSKSIKNLKIFTLKPKQKKYGINTVCRGIKFDWKHDVLDFNDVMQEAVNIQDEVLLTNLHSYVVRFTTIFTDYSTSIPSLYLPRKHSNISWLSFSSQSTNLVGRDSELKTLSDFLETNRQFSWWVATGPAGCGKSRLALELCNVYLDRGWYVGFLPRSNNNFNWAKYKPLKNTLIVVDYVMGRTKEISDLVLELSRASDNMDSSTRILLLERDSETWMNKFIREDSLSESAEIVSAKYHQPELKLTGLTQSAMLEMAKNLNLSRHGMWNQNTERRFVEWMNRDDINCRPLYVMLLSEFPNVEEPNELLRTVLKREAGKRREQIEGDELFIKYENLLFLSTLVGGILPKEGDFNHISSSDSAGLLPDLGILDFNKYFSVSCSYDETDSIPGLQPDLIGELHVLDCLNIKGVAGLSYKKLLTTAYDNQPDDVIAFVTKCYFDFSNHPGFQKLFDLPLNSREYRLIKAKLVAQSSCFPSIIFDEFLQNELDNITLTGDSYPDESELNNWIAKSEYNYGCSLMFPKYSSFLLLFLKISRAESINEAKKRFNAVVSRAGEHSKITFMALLNMGTLIDDENRDEAIKIYTKVIESKYSEDETRACALNNRANIYQKRKDHRSAIRDRERIFALSNTSADHRFVAYFGCGESHFSLKMYDRVVQDMTMIIESVDIRKSDKLCAFIVRSVSYYFMEEVRPNSVKDLEQATNMLIDFVEEGELKIKLKRLTEYCLAKDWGESEILLAAIEDGDKDWVTDILLEIYRLLITIENGNDDQIEKEKWNDLRKLAISKANRMRVYNP